MTRLGHERITFAAMYGPDLLYSHDPWAWSEQLSSCRSEIAD